MAQEAQVKEQVLDEEAVPDSPASSNHNEAKSVLKINNELSQKL